MNKRQLLYGGSLALFFVFFCNVGLFSVRVWEHELLDQLDEKQSIIVRCNQQLASQQTLTAQQVFKLSTQAAELAEVRSHSIVPLVDVGALDTPQPPPRQFAKNVPDLSPSPLVPIPILLLAHKRAHYLKRTLKSLFGQNPDPARFPVIISQDQNDTSVFSLVKTFPVSHHLVFMDRTPLPHLQEWESEAYYYISQHYYFALHHVFEVLKLPHVVIMEEDLEVAPDFLSFFAATLPILQRDHSLWCISAWNDNAQPSFQWRKDRLQRTSFFPGLGWLLPERVWRDIGPRWPRAYWDDWLREPAQRRGRDCLQPELPRSHTFGEEGASQGQFYSTYLKDLALGSEAVQFHSLDLSYLAKHKWEFHFGNMVRSAQLVERSSEARGSRGRDQVFMVQYGSDKEYAEIANQLGLIPDMKANVARSSYRGVVSLPLERNNTLLLAPAGIIFALG